MEPTTARTLLERERERLMELRAGLVADDEGGERVDAAPLHAADVASEVFEREKQRSIRHQVEGDLRDVDDALRRVGSGAVPPGRACWAPPGGAPRSPAPRPPASAAPEGMWEGDRLALRVPAGRYEDGDGHTTERTAARDAGRNLDLVPDQEEVEERIDVGPEDRALHLTDPARVEAGALSPRDLAALEDRGLPGEDERQSAADVDEEER